MIWPSKGASMSVLKGAEFRKAQLAQIGNRGSAKVLGQSLLGLGMDLGYLNLVPSHCPPLTALLREAASRRDHPTAALRHHLELPLHTLRGRWKKSMDVAGNT